MVSESGREATALGTRNSELRTLVIQTAHLGDVVLTLPLLQRLAEQHGPVDVITTPAAAPLAEHHPAVRRVIPYDKHGSDRGLAALFRLARRLRGTGYSRVVLPHGSLRSAALACMSGAEHRVGFADAPGRLGFSTRIPRPLRGHMSARLLALAGGGATPGRPWLHLTPADRHLAAEWLTACGIVEPFVVLAPGSRWGTKRWPYFAELALALPHQIVVIGGPGDLGLADSITSGAKGRAWSATGILGLRASAALIERAAILVTNDSVALHLATALERPVLALFGPTVPAFGFGPLDGEPVIEHPALDCRPCSPHGPNSCPLGHHRCMRELEVARVALALEARLARDI